MLRREFFLKAMKAGEYKRKAWVISAFSLVKEIPDQWKKEPFPYRIVQTPAGHFFIDPEKGNSLSMIEDAPAGVPLFAFSDSVELAKGDVENVFEDTVHTCYGNVLFNYTCLIWPFGTKVAFKTGRINASKLEQELLDRVVDTNPVAAAHMPVGFIAPPIVEHTHAPLPVNEYVKFCDAMFHLAGYTQLCVPAKTAKEMVAPPGIKELRDRLLKENKDRLHDPAVIAAIMKQLIAYDKDYLKGDEAMNFLIKGKSFDVVRSKLFLMHGAEFGFGEGGMDLIDNSLSEGWNVEKFPSMMDSLRAGSYNRGAETMLGGEAVKWLLRASSNMVITKADCGTKLGLGMVVDKKNIYKLPGFSVVTEQGHQKITSAEDAQQYLGKHIMLRSPMFCSLDKTDYCATCVGDRLSVNPTALSSAISEYGSTFMLISMKAMHGKSLETQRMNYQTALM
jgi:hypothetical protein